MTAATINPPAATCLKASLALILHYLTGIAFNERMVPKVNPLNLSSPIVIPYLRSTKLAMIGQGSETAEEFFFNMF